MPQKYLIHTRPVPRRFKTIAKSGVIAWEEGCLKCAVCVKKRCVYGVYDHRGLDSRQMVDSIDNECMSCLRCVQGCPRELIHKSINPEYRALGDPYWMPDIISKLWYQAETGKIPVSGAGYPGPFTGAGFDAMWTDMSEIVRPTRDGIHGREYISTVINLGKRPDHLNFAEGEEMKGSVPLLTDIVLPIILRVPPFGAFMERTIKGWAMAAKKLGTFLALPGQQINESLDELRPWLMPDAAIKEHFNADNLYKGVRICESLYGEDEEYKAAAQRNEQGFPMVSIRLPMMSGVEEKAVSLVRQGISIIHLEGGMDGRDMGDERLFLKDRIRMVHGALVDAGIRGEVTLLVSGGLAMAEHVAKSIICGADGVFIDFPILIALECRMCRRCTMGLSCPVDIGEAPSAWVAARVVNLMGAWHNQLLEVMGAMGIRDVRRLRGETGRAMFFEELDRAAFESLGKIQGGRDIE